MTAIAPERRRRARGHGVRRASALLLATALALGAAIALRLPGAWRTGNGLNHVSGAWMALAEDLAHGTFYRPVLDPELGYGGTRFFPLVFSLHAALRAAGLQLLAGGYALSLVAGVLAVLGVALFLRRAGLPRPAALAFGLLGFAAFATQHALAAARGVLLPAALDLLGLAALARGPSRGALGAAIALFALAFAGKGTALTAPAAACAWLLHRRERRAAAALALGVWAGVLVVIALSDALSGGRFLAIVLADATGGAVAHDVLLAPLRLFEHFTIADPAAMALVGTAAAATLASAPARLEAARAGRVDARLLPALWLVAAAATVGIVFASPGTGVNHLVELELASALAIGAAWPSRDTAGLVARSLSPVIGALGIAVAIGLAREDARTSRLAELREVAAELPPRAPVLSEDPLLSVVLGERPYVLDTWMLRLAAERDRGLQRPLLEAVEKGEFAAVILFQKLGTPEAELWYRRGDFGLDVVADVERHYRLAATHGRYQVYVPTVAGAPRPAPVARAPEAPGPAPLDAVAPVRAAEASPRRAPRLARRRRRG